MSTEFRLKLPNGIDYRNSLLKNGKCCDGYTAVSGASYDSYVSCREQGWHFIHATGDAACGDQSLGATLFGNDQTFWYWWYVPAATPTEWPWGDQFTFTDPFSYDPQTFYETYKTIPGGVSSAIGFTLTGRPQRIPGTDPLDKNYWNNPIKETEYKHPNFLIKNHSWPVNQYQPTTGQLWDINSNNNNGYRMPGATGVSFGWEPLPQSGILKEFINNSGVTGTIAVSSADVGGVTYQLLDFLRFKHAHPYSKRILQPRSYEQELSHSRITPTWYSALVDGKTGLGPRNESQRVSSPWQDNFSIDISESFKTYLSKLKDQLGITISYVLVDDEYLSHAFHPGSWGTPHIDSLQYGVGGYIPDREFPLPGIKGTTGFNGTIPEWPTDSRPSNWTSGITWWINAGDQRGTYYNSSPNPNGNIVYNIMNDSRWNDQGLTAFNGMTLGALFTKRYNDLRTSWINGFSGTSQASQINDNTIPTSVEIINFMKGWSGQYLKGTTHEWMPVGATTWQLYNPPPALGITKIWLPATEWFFSSWPNYPVKIDGITMYEYNTIWTPYGGTDNLRTLSNLSSQVTFDSRPDHFLKTELISRPSIINRSAWAWSLLHVFIPAWDCIVNDIQVSQYYYDSFCKNPLSGITGRFSGITGYSGITMIRYQSYDINAEECIYLINSNAGEVPYQLGGKNSMHCPVGYGNVGGNSTSIVPLLAQSDLERLLKYNNAWGYRLGYVKSATTNLEKYKIYHIAEAPVMGLNGITIDPPQQGISYYLARWPSNEFVGLAPGATFTVVPAGITQSKIDVARGWARQVVFFQHVRAIMRSDPMGHLKLAPMIRPRESEQIYHLALHGANPITLFDENQEAFTNQNYVTDAIVTEKILSIINSMTGGGRLVPLGRYSGPTGTTWAESGSTGGDGNVVKMDQLVLENALEDYIMTGAKVVTGPFTGRHIWRITPSPARFENWTLSTSEGIQANTGITADDIRYDLRYDPLQGGRENSRGFFVIKNNSTAPIIELPPKDRP